MWLPLKRMRNNAGTNPGTTAGKNAGKNASVRLVSRIGCWGLMLTALGAPRSAGAALNWQVTSNLAILDNIYGYSVTNFNNRIWVVGYKPGDQIEGVPATKEFWSTLDGTGWVHWLEHPGAVTPRPGHKMLGYNNSLWYIGNNASTTNPQGDVWSSANAVDWTHVNATPLFGYRMG